MSRWGPPNASNPLGVGWGEPVHAATDPHGKVDLERTWEARGDEEQSRYAPKVRAGTSEWRRERLENRG